MSLTERVPVAAAGWFDLV